MASFTVGFIEVLRVDVRELRGRPRADSWARTGPLTLADARVIGRCVTGAEEGIVVAAA